MINTIKIGLLLCLLIISGCIEGAKETGIGELFEVATLPDLPPAQGVEIQHGLAGAFSGTSNGAIIVAGGANFPEGMPWKGGKKNWWDNIYVFENGKWVVDPTFKLKTPLAYGVSVQLDEGILCVGGDSGTSKTGDVFLLTWNSELKKVDLKNFPSIPVPLGYMSGTKVGNEVYITGGIETDASTKYFFRLDLSKRGTPDFKWEILDPWPGPARAFSATVAQSDGKEDALFLFGGRNIDVNQNAVPLSDAYLFSPSKNQWKKLNEIGTGYKKTPLMAGTVQAKGSHHIVFFGGSDGKLFLKLLELQNQTKDLTLDSTVIKKHKTEQLSILKNHPGFSREVLSYNTVTGMWAKIGELSSGSPVTTNAIAYNDDTVIPSGEISPGVRTPKMLKIQWESMDSSFGWINYSVVMVYLIGMVLIGVFFSRRQKTTTDYFKGGGRVPWWAAGLSLFGTMLSAITFMAIPAKTYTTDWAYFMYNMTIIIAAPLIVWLFIPFYNRLKITSAYEYLELRFNLLTRLLGSASFIVFQLGRIGIVLFLPSIAISLVTGIDVSLCILVMGVLSIVYTSLGGIEAVIWTDVVQVVVLLGGAILSFVIIIFALDGGLSEIVEVGIQDQKFEILNLSMDWTEPTLWVVLVGGIAGQIITQGTDQTIVQRYITSSNIKDSKRTVYTNALMILPASLLFFGIGTGLYAFFKANPSEVVPLLSNNDAIFPWFIVSQLPTGVSGLLIAAIFSAAMSTLSSSMNSGATAFCTDFYKRFKKDTTDLQLLKMARLSTVFLGIAGTLFGLWMATSDIKSLWDEFSKILGLFTGGLGGVFLLGMLFKKANGIGAVTGIVASGIVQWIVVEYTNLNLLMYTTTGLISCLLIGVLVSYIFPNRTPMDNDLVV